MRRPRLSGAALFSLLTLVLLLAGCPKRPVTSGISALVPSGTGPAGATPRSPSGSSTAAPRPSEFAATETLKDIHFDFDRYDVRSDDARDP
jgi:hypothetical protein